jgi:hypothetical protein
LSSLTLSKSQAATSLNRMKSTLQGWKEKAHEQTEHVVGIATTAVAGYGLGLADARFGEDAVWGMSTSLATAIVGHGLAMFEVGGAMPSSLFRSAGNAGLSIYAYKSGFEMGSRGR